MARVFTKLRLRDGSKPGRYRISIVDPNGTALFASEAWSSEGAFVTLILDLRQARWAHRVRIEHDDDIEEYLIKRMQP